MGRGKARRSLDLIDQARDILERIQPASVRAVCYKLFTLGVIDSMEKSCTNRVSTQLTWAREQGLIPWSWIVDEHRDVEQVNAFRNPAEYVEAVKRSYRRDRWTDQPVRIEVWSEKGTVRGTLAPVLDEFGVPFRVMHGYGSSTAVHDAAESSTFSTKPLIVFYVGDWDPSGLHMSDADLPRRLERYDAELTLVRLAIIKTDTTNRTLPYFPASSKRGDPRFAWFVNNFGLKCWELDALDPNHLRERLRDAIVERLDVFAWDRAERTEAAEQESLLTILNAWPGISGQASK